MKPLKISSEEDVQTQKCAGKVMYTVFGKEKVHPLGFFESWSDYQL